MSFGLIAHRGAVLFASRQLNLKTLVPIQTLKCTQLRRVLDPTSQTIQPIFAPFNSVIKSYKSTDAKKTTLEKRTRQVYSKKDDKFIIELVELNGYTIATFKKIAKALGRRYPYNVKAHYDEYIVKQYDVKGFFSPEEDQKIIEHVKIYGEDKESFEIIAKILGRPINSVRERCYRLFSANEYDINSDSKPWDYTEDEKLINFVFQLKEIDSHNVPSLWEIKKSEFSEIAGELKRSTESVYQHWQNSILPFFEPHLEKLVSSKYLKKDIFEIAVSRFEKTTQQRGYSDDDIKFIVKQIKQKGDVSETWVFIAKKLGKKHPEVVQSFYYNHILQTPKVKGSFTPEEDEFILRHVKENGRTHKSFKDLTKELGRGSYLSVEGRFNKLVSTNEFEINAKRKAWELDEDMSLIDHIFNIKEIKAGDISSIENVKSSEFTAVATELRRSSISCYLRWMQHIAPTLKTHLMKLPMTNDWKKDFLSHIVNNNIKYKREIDIDQILKEIAPGQTSRSILLHLNTLKREAVNGVKKQSKLPLCDLVSKRLKEQSPINSLFNENHKGEQKRLERCQDVISNYEKLI